MSKSWLLCVLLGTLAWGQAAPGGPPPTRPAQPQPSATAKPPAPSPADAAAKVPADAAVITVVGVCPTLSKTGAAPGATAKSATAEKTPSADCKTVVTKAEFERLMNSIPNPTPQMKRQVATVLPRLIAMSETAKERGLDKTPQYAELLKVQEMQILSNELQRKISEDAANVPQADIETYYKDNPEAFEQFNLDRLFVPRAKQVEAATEEGDKDEKLTEEQQKAKQAAQKAKTEEGEQAMAKLADSLRVRAAAGEDFVKLQKEAFEAAGMKIESPTVTLATVRRTAIPSAHAAVFELKPGEVSQVIHDSGGHYIYKLNSKEQLSLEKAKTEIRNTLQNQRTRDMMDQVNSSFKVETNEAYFGPAGPGQAPAPRVPNPRMPPGPTGQPQNPPPTAQPSAPQPPTAKPN